jgi:hypothetical protein
MWGNIIVDIGYWTLVQIVFEVEADVHIDRRVIARKFIRNCPELYFSSQIEIYRPGARSFQCVGIRSAGCTKFHQPQTPQLAN